MSRDTERIRVLKMNPEGFGNPLVCPIEHHGPHPQQDAFDILRDLVMNSEADDRFEVELSEMTRAEYDALGEHGGW